MNTKEVAKEANDFIIPELGVETSQKGKSEEDLALEVLSQDNGDIHVHPDLYVKPTDFGAESLAAALKLSNELENREPVISIVPKYMEFSKAGTKERGVFMGFHKMLVKEKEQTAEKSYKEIDGILWLAKGELWLNAGAALVGSVKRSNIEKGTPIEIEYTGRKGDVKLYDVRLL